MTVRCRRDFRSPSSCLRVLLTSHPEITAARYSGKPPWQYDPGPAGKIASVS